MAQHFRRDMGADVYRKLAKGERTVIRDLIDYAVGVANNFLIPEGCDRALWRDLDAHARCYFRMLDMKSRSPTKFAANRQHHESIPEMIQSLAKTGSR